MEKRRTINIKNQMAFTLVELLAVLVILTIILAIAVPTITGMIKSASKGSFESDAKMVLKAVDYRKLANNSFDESAVNKENLSELLGLTSENYATLNITVEEGVPVISIIGVGKWEGLIACGTYNNMRVVESSGECEIDLVPPVLTLIGEERVNMYIGQTYSDAGATANDNLAGDLTNSIVVTGSVNPNLPGTYTITYSVTDTLGNVSTRTRYITVIDNAFPAITFNPTGYDVYAQTREITITASDLGLVDNASLRYVWTTSTVEPSSDAFINAYTNGENIATPVGVTGIYYLWAEVSDTAGNRTAINSGAVNLDNTKPIITLNGDSSVTINKGSVYSDAGAVANDNIDGTISVVSSGAVDINIVGTYTITYDAVDSSNNTAEPVTRTVNVVDALAPVITILGNNPATIEAGSTYSDAGATAIDDVDGDVTARIVVTGTVNPNVLGTYTITYTVVDTAGNDAVATRTVDVVDTTAPTIVTATAGTMINKDPTFASGTNGTAVYNNLANGNVTVTRVTMSTPTGSGYGLNITSTGTASPGWGGFYFATPTSASKVFITRIIAKIPVGYTINWASNAYGGGSMTWLTSQAGTGDWKEYLCQVNVGTDGTYSSTNFFYLSGGTTPTTANPLTWSVAYATVHDTTLWGTSNNILVTATDGASGITGYGINQSSTTAPTFTSVAATPSLSNTFTNITANGTYYVWLKDAKGNTSKKAVTVSYVDTTKPVITLIGSSTMSLDKGTAYVEPGATATDSQSGVSGSVSVSGSVNKDVVGTYVLTYNISDRAGNAAVPVTRTVSVIQTQVLTSTTVTVGESSTQNQTKTVNLPGLVSVTSVTVNTGSVSYTVSGENVNLSTINGAYTRYESVPYQAYDCWPATCCYTSCWSCTQSYTGTCCGCPGDWPTNQSCCSPCQSCGYVTRYTTVYYYSYTVTINYYKRT